jgi:hypothetical protein
VPLDVTAATVCSSRLDQPKSLPRVSRITRAEHDPLSFMDSPLLHEIELEVTPDTVSSPSWVRTS